MSGNRRSVRAHDLVAAIAEVAAPPYPEIGPDHDANARNAEGFRDLQRSRAHHVASAARYVTEHEPSADVINAFARGLRRDARQASYPVPAEPEAGTG